MIGRGRKSRAPARGWPPRLPTFGAAALAASALLCSAGCRRDVNLLRPPTDGPVIDVPSADATNDEASGPPDSSIQPSCQGLGEPVRFLTATGLTCAATLAARAHRTAVCSCSDWIAPQPVSVFNSPMMPSGVATPAAIGVNGSLTSTNDMTVPGAVHASGAKGISVSAQQFSINGSLRSGGSITFTGPAPQAIIGGDVYAAGDVIGPAKIGGTLHLPATSLMGAATTAAATSRETVTVPPPCDCTLPFDVSAAIAGAMATNDNASVPGLSVDRLASVTMNTTLDLPCGVYAFSSISALATLTIYIRGRVLIAVAGDVLLQQRFAVAIDPGGELDLLLQGSLTVNSALLPVGTASAELFRVWMKGPGPMVMPNTPILGGIIHAPGAPLTAAHGISVIGSITAASLSIGGPLNATYNDGVLSGGLVCGDPKVDPLP